MRPVSQTTQLGLHRSPPADARSGLLTSPGASRAHHLRGEAARAGDLTRPLRLSLSLSRRERSGRAPTSRMSVREMSTGRSPLPLASFVGTGPSAGAVPVGRARSACPQLPRRPLGHADTPPALGLTPGGQERAPRGPGVHRPPLHSNGCTQRPPHPTANSCCPQTLRAGSHFLKRAPQGTGLGIVSDPRAMPGTGEEEQPVHSRVGVLPALPLAD